MGRCEQIHRALSADAQHRFRSRQSRGVLGLVGAHPPAAKERRLRTKKPGYQISAIKAMLDRLAQTFVPGGGSSNTFGIPQYFSAPDSTSTSVELIWEANSAAAGFNIYRSPSGIGSYTKINSQPVSGGSFVDRGLPPNTTYDYEARAIDGQSSL